VLSRDESRDQSQSLLDIRRDSVKPAATLARYHCEKIVVDQKLIASVDSN
jgi:hypothetical protein